MAKRTVTVFNTVGSKKTIIETEAQTWEELKHDLDAKEIAHNGMRAIVGENQTTLESNGARLPLGLTVGSELTNDFTLFLSPRKIKSGKKEVFPKKRILALLKRARTDIETIENRINKNIKKSRYIALLKRTKKDLEMVEALVINNGIVISAITKEINILSKKAKEIENSIEE